MSDAVCAREDEPVVAVKIFDGFVQWRVAFRLDDLDGRARDDARAVAFQLGGEFSRLRPCTCDDNRALCERLLVSLAQRSVRSDFDIAKIFLHATPVSPMSKRSAPSSVSRAGKRSSCMFGFRRIAFERIAHDHIARAAGDQPFKPQLIIHGAWRERQSATGSRRLRRAVANVRLCTPHAFLRVQAWTRVVLSPHRESASLCRAPPARPRAASGPWRLARLCAARSPCDASPPAARIIAS